MTKLCKCALIVLIFLLITYIISYSTNILARQRNENEHDDLFEPWQNHISTYSPPCKIKAEFLDPPLGLIALLASFPGSGNTWARYLLEQYSGILTGSIHYDKALADELGGEGVYDGRVLAIKTHNYPDSPDEYTYKTNVINFDKAILIVRHPKDSIIAEVSRLFNNDHVAIIEENKWYNEDVQRCMIKLASEWTQFNQYWLSEYLGSLLVVQYEKLCSDPLNEINKIMSFLDRLPYDRGVACLNISHNGKFKRKPKSFEAFLNVTTINAINLAVNSTSQILTKFDIRYKVIL